MTLKSLRSRVRCRSDPEFSSRASISMRTALLGSVLLVSVLTLAHSSLALHRLDTLIALRHASGVCSQ